jgi:trans-aconitate methyltransferase
MQNLPTAEVYEKEFTFMPWGRLIEKVKQNVISNAPRGSKVLDLLCGPGYLIGQIQKARPDMEYLGIDLEAEFINYARQNYPKVNFLVADAFNWMPENKFDVVLCTAGVHHLPDEKQEPFIKKIADLLTATGFAIIADEYLLATIQMGAPPDVIDAAVQVLRNDVLLIEWKTSVRKRSKMLRKYFKDQIALKTWPLDLVTDYGDYYFVLCNLG